MQTRREHVNSNQKRPNLDLLVAPQQEVAAANHYTTVWPLPLCNILSYFRHIFHICNILLKP